MHAIAAAIYAADPHLWDWLKEMECTTNPQLLADAVIAELGLRIQVAGPDGIAYGKHRYVTDWIAND